MTTAHEVLAPNAVRGWELRWLLTITLRNHAEPMTVAQMVTELERRGFAFDRRPSQAVSDALRAEIGKGRVRRVSRGVYAFAGMPHTTLVRFRRNVRWVTAARAFATVRSDLHRIPGNR